MNAAEKKPCPECAKAEIPKYWKRCYACEEQRIIDAAEVVEPSSPLCIVGSDTFFGDIEDALEDYAGCYAHPCEEEPLRVNAKRLAAHLAERVVEDMCEEAFEDAADHVNGEDSLRYAFEVALDAFNEAQTANSWVPVTKAVFRIPASVDTRRMAETGTGSVRSTSGAVPKGDAQ